jgi:hypothetical protein
VHGRVGRYQNTIDDVLTSGLLQDKLCAAVGLATPNHRVKQVSMSVSLRHLTMLPSSMMSATMSPDSRFAGFWTTLPIHHRLVAWAAPRFRFPSGGLCDVRCACIMQSAMQEYTGIPSQQHQQHLAIASRGCHTSAHQTWRARAGSKLWR